MLPGCVRKTDPRPEPRIDVRYGFERDRRDAAPAGFSFPTVEGEPPARWVVQAVDGAPEGKQALVQRAPMADRRRFLVALADTPPRADLTAEVRCRMADGAHDRACGLVFRHQDDGSYYVVRADALDANVRLYHVKGNRRARIGEFLARLSSNDWHTLRVMAQGSRVVVWLDGRAIMDIHDSTLTTPGRVGVWTKGSSVTYFDALSVGPVE